MEKMDMLITMIPNNKTLRDGNNLNSECVDCFHAININSKSFFQPFDPQYQYIKTAIIEFTEKIISFHHTQQIDEVDLIQLHSFEFFQKICNIYFSNLEDRIKLVNDNENTKYSTFLQCDNNVVFHISGQTDSVLLYHDVPIATWKNKSLLSTLNLIPENAQDLVDVKATSEIFKKFIGLIPLRFTGILTNGLIWSIAIQSFINGEYTYIRTLPINTCSIEEDKITILDENIDIVTSLLVYHLQTIKSIIDMVDNYIIKLNQPISNQIYDDDDDDIDFDFGGSNVYLSVAYFGYDDDDDEEYDENCEVNS